MRNLLYNLSERAPLWKCPIFERDNDFTGRRVRWYRYFLRFFVPQSVHQPHLTCATPLRPGNSITRGVPPHNSRPGSLGTGALSSLRRTPSFFVTLARVKSYTLILGCFRLSEMAMEVIRWRRWWSPPKYYEVDRVAATSGKTLSLVLARLFLFERDDRFTFILSRWDDYIFRDEKPTWENIVGVLCKYS